MALFDSSKKKATAMIHVTFVNQEDHSIIGQCELSPEQLPESFALNTVMHLGDEDWEILKAEPKEKHEFVVTGELTLTMRRIETLDPADILFSLPTIANELPAFSETTFSANFTHEMREDDWRQCEFFEIHQLDRVLMELEKIEDLKSHHQVDTSSDICAFDKIHVRDLTDLPELSFSLMALLNLLQVSDVGAIKFEKNAEYIAQGFAVETASNLFYGVLGLEDKEPLTLENLVVRVLGVQPKTENREEISQLLQAFNLLYVDWCETTSMDRLN